VNLGSASTFLSLAPGSSLPLSIGNIDADLDNLFGPTWDTRADVLWSVSGVQKSGGLGLPNNTMFATNNNPLSVVLGSQNSTAWPRPSSFGAGAPAGKIQSMSLKFAQGTTGAISGTDQIESSTAGVFALFQPGGQNNSFISYMPGGINTTGTSTYSLFNDAGGIEGSFGSGAAGSVLDLFDIRPGTGDSGFAGNFSINSGANVTFTSAVPEPASALMLCAGMGSLAFIRRRQRA
jgi:hypothetical protein